MRGKVQRAELKSCILPLQVCERWYTNRYCMYFYRPLNKQAQARLRGSGALLHGTTPQRSCIMTPTETFEQPVPSCTGTTSSSSAAAHTNRCWSLRCSQVNASRAKFRSRSMKATSRPSRPLMGRKLGLETGRLRGMLVGSEQDLLQWALHLEVCSDVSSRSASKDLVVDASKSAAASRLVLPAPPFQ